VSKYQRKLGRLLSRFIRDPAEVEDVAQEAFIKAYRALPPSRESAFYTWLYRIGSTRQELSGGDRSPRATTTEFDSEDAENFEDGEYSGTSIPENELMSKQIAKPS